MAIIGVFSIKKGIYLNITHLFLISMILFQCQHDNVQRMKRLESYRTEQGKRKRVQRKVNRVEEQKLRYRNRLLFQMFLHSVISYTNKYENKLWYMLDHLAVWDLMRNRWLNFFKFYFVLVEC